MSLPFINLLVLQLIAHFLCDFVFLNETDAQAKNVNGFSSKHLYIHTLFVFMFSFVLAMNVHFWWCSLVIGVSHFIIDGIKSKLTKKIPTGKWIFFTDQIVHIFIIFLITGAYAYHARNFNKYFEWVKLFFQSTNVLLYVLGYLMCLKPSNIVIRQIINKWLIDKDINRDKLIDAGQLIGNIERVLILSFILVNQFEAIGFLLAAKSLLRFKEAEAEKKSEYVLLGTLVSFGSAILIGLIIKGILKMFNY